MPVILILVGVSFLTASLSLIGGLLFLTDTKIARKVQKIGPVIAAAILLYAVFGDIIPEILEDEYLPTLEMIGLIVLGFVVCGVLGWVLGHFHHHADAHKAKDEKIDRSRSVAISMLIVDSIHNIADGIVVGVSFIASPATGLSTCLATIAHEIPQEVGDFAIMQKAKLARKKIIKYQFLSALLLVPAAVLTYLIGDSLAAGLPVVLSLVAGFLLYIAFSEIYYIYDLVRSKMPKQLK